ncbi:helix-turn-helix domain-containing protein [Bacillus sp. ISL-34]|nr:helix-turn-helix domain-containing protein [Bacillus sp. ISL-34]
MVKIPSYIMSKILMAEKWGVSRTTIYRYLKKTLK